MKIRIAAIAAATVLAVLLTGCGAAAPAASAPATTDAGVQQVQETPEPLVAEKPASTYSSDDDQYLSELSAAYERRADLKSQIPNATDEQLIAAAHAACEQLPSIGYDTTLAHVIEGETPNGLGTYQDSAIIAAVAAHVYCPAS